VNLQANLFKVFFGVLIVLLHIKLANSQNLKDALSAHQALTLGDLQLAEFYATRALSDNDLIGSDRAAVFSYRGDAKRRMGNFEESVDDYSNAIEIGLPAAFMARVLNNRGLALFGMFQWETAVRDFREALVLDPDFIIAMDNLGTGLMAMGNMQEAINTFTEAMLADPSNARVINNRGRAYMVLKFFEEAIQDFSTAIELGNSNIATPLFNRGIAHESLGNREAARKDFERALALRPNELTYQDKFREYRLIP